MANSSKRQRRLWDTYTFLGFRPQPTVRGVFGDPKARIITLARRAKNGLRVLRANSFGFASVGFLCFPSTTMTLMGRLSAPLFVAFASFAGFVDGRPRLHRSGIELVKLIDAQALIRSF